jgi:thiosulfate/3-mercaptopyruvate sulfurtransferase
MLSVGIGDESLVVAYDDEGGVIAARLVWMLRVTERSAALLDGGIQSFRAPLEVGPPPDPTPAGPFTVRPWPREYLASINDACDPTNIVVDARAPERFAGEKEPIDPRAGHIPGARNLPCRSNLDAEGRFLPVDALRSRFESAGVVAAPVSRSMISYCGSGVTACHNLIALEHANLGPGRLYPGSWSQYSHDSARVVGLGRDPDQAN